MALKLIFGIQSPLKSNKSLLFTVNDLLEFPQRRASGSAVILK